jgi:hypothetical protein
MTSSPFLGAAFTPDGVEDGVLVGVGVRDPREHAVRSRTRLTAAARTK